VRTPRKYGENVRTAEVRETASDGSAARTLTLNVIGADLFVRHPLPPHGDVTIGRGRQATVSIDDISISRSHAVLHVGAQLTITDQGSSNGTRVGGCRVAPNESRVVVVGEAIELGSITVVVMVAGRGPAARPRRIWTHDFFEARLEDECARAAQTPFAIARLSIRGAAPDAVVQEELAHVLDTEHAVAPYGPGEYELLLVGVSPEAATALTDRLASRLALTGVQLKRGLACFPRDGRTPEALVAHACRALRGSNGNGATALVVIDPAMMRVHQLAERVAAGNISVLLLGETGSGKEILAEAVHRHSPRAKKPLLRLNCAALSENLLESELFGHEKGAFSGAVQAKPGLLETAEGGTVFLDELGEIPLSLQTKLLRVIEERKVTRVGGLKPKAIDVRFISATNRNLEEEIVRGTFRQDLYYRLNGIALVIPPLRERPTEIAELAQVFLERAAHDLGRPPPRLSPEALALLQRYVWPGNIRELRNVMERAVLLCSGSEIKLEHLPVDKMSSSFADARPRRATYYRANAAPAPGLAPPPPSTAPPGADATVPSQRVPSFSPPSDERERIIAALDQCAGNQTSAARLLGMSRGTLVQRLDQYGLPRPRKR
jgi:DNA-binding NtrC family response regulator